MNREQYEFSNMFWEDTEFNIEDGIPKYYEMKEDEMVFHFLNGKEIKDFFKIKSKENPEVMQDIRYKKLMRILKIN